MSTSVVSYQPTTFSELETFCKRICATGMVPAAYKGKPDEAAVAIMAGNEWGLPPLASLQSIAVINGTPRVFGDAMAGVAMNKGLIRGMKEWFEGEEYKEDFAAVCEVHRPDGSMVSQRFSVADAKKANLWGKAGPWTQYPKRMLQFRARSWTLRDAAPHMYFGMSFEEARDIDIAEQPHSGPDKARDITPRSHNPGPRAEVEAVLAASSKAPPPQPYDDDGVIVDDDQPSLIDDLPEQHDPDPLKILGAKGAIGFLAALRSGLEQADLLEADRLWELYRDRAKQADEKVKAGDYASLAKLVASKIADEEASDPN